MKIDTVPEMANLRSRTALVTGASQGIGLAISKSLLAEEVQVTMSARNEDILRNVTAELAVDDIAAYAEPMDLADSASIAAATRAVIKRMPTLDILVLCGGTYEFSHWDDDVTEALRQSLAINVAGNAQLVSHLLPTLKNGGGDIVFINSSIVNGNGVGNPAFAASQHALRSLADSLRASVNADGVRVTSIYPGRTATARQQSIASHAGRPFDLSGCIDPADVAAAVVHSLKQPASAEVTDLHIRQSSGT